MGINDVNQLYLSGEVQGVPVFDHSAYGEEFFCAFLCCRRLSGTVDTLPVLAPQPLAVQLRPGLRLAVAGQLRSYNEYAGADTHLRLRAFAQSVAPAIEAADQNRVVLEGHLCKPPVYRMTPFGREIADLLLAVNRRHGKSDYIPAIVWGENARFAGGLGVGQKVRLEGRFQSREYEKALQDGRREARRAYEISAGGIYQIL